ncbi:hypothetical protein M441DRAFT_242438 [Trichoderma asperellum CBS 433.97]|uniref:Uncharacterized protein n=1 Tax=Trichoderma asperellum (strain ATCC 204424 / CBS 433.97 / NBRC 101777) TaxID=1042311 RepID=A0A2T3Z2D9_TRIA4|nr:hypothetical protein M441DRAFT_242438 [Trichoderma asperellum CBS 433.97]PTB38967.1 hypothetical protein M441DRAFT_242438 [Trichoderma asperellum CBS 433.97]
MPLRKFYLSYLCQFFFFLAAALSTWTLLFIFFLPPSLHFSPLHSSVTLSLSLIPFLFYYLFFSIHNFYSILSHCGRGGNLRFVCWVGIIL